MLKGIKHIYSSRCHFWCLFCACVFPPGIILLLPEDISLTVTVYLLLLSSFSFCVSEKPSISSSLLTDIICGHRSLC